MLAISSPLIRSAAQFSRMAVQKGFGPSTMAPFSLLGSSRCFHATQPAQGIGAAVGVAYMTYGVCSDLPLSLIDMGVTGAIGTFATAKAFAKDDDSFIEEIGTAVMYSLGVAGVGIVCCMSGVHDAAAPKKVIAELDSRSQESSDKAA